MPEESREMLIRVRVTPNSKRPEVTRTGPESYSVKVDERAIGGRANTRLIEILADHLGVKKPQISIVKGQRSRDKLITLKR